MTQEINNDVRIDLENRILDNLSNHLDTFESWNRFANNRFIEFRISKNLSGEIKITKRILKTITKENINDENIIEKISLKELPLYALEYFDREIQKKIEYYTKKEKDMVTVKDLILYLQKQNPDDIIFRLDLGEDFLSKEELEEERGNFKIEKGKNYPNLVGRGIVFI